MMERQDIKTVSKIVEKRLKEVAKKEQARKEAEEKELSKDDDFTSDQASSATAQTDTQDLTQTDTQIEGANNADKIYLYGGLSCLILGGALWYWEKKRGNN